MTTYRHVYVHVPFCARRCSYCDFAIAVRRNVPTGDFIEGLRAELATLALPPLTLDTLYLGGGTPSRLGADGVAHLMDTLRAQVSLASGAEVTLEANPEDITPEAVRAWQRAGITRLSIGVQSFDDRVLTWMHRVHDGAAAMRAVQVARDNGLTSLSLDLIFAVPESLQRDWRRDLDTMLDIAPSHLSLYGLTVETHTPLGKWHARGDVAETPEERYESEFLDATRALTSAGFEHYEVSNFAQPGQRAVHNSAYWRGVPYLGLGPSAHGFDGQDRRWNVEAYAAWLARTRSGESTVDGYETLTADNRIAESVYLGLRTRDGLEVVESEWQTLSPWRDAGWIESIGTGPSGRVRCTPLGWLRLDRLAADLTALRSRS